MAVRPANGDIDNARTCDISNRLRGRLSGIDIIDLVASNVVVRARSVYVTKAPSCIVEDVVTVSGC
jgi:hypothetical protein